MWDIAVAPWEYVDQISALYWEWGGCEVSGAKFFLQWHTGTFARDSSRQAWSWKGEYYGSSDWSVVVLFVERDRQHEC